MTLGLVCRFPRCTIRLVTSLQNLNEFFSAVTLDVVTPGSVHLPGDDGSEKVDGNFLVIKAAMSQQLPAAEYLHLIFELGVEYRKLDLTSCINHYLSISECRHIPPETTCFPFMLRLCPFRYPESWQSFLLVLDRLVSLDGLDLIAKPGAYNQEGIAFLWIGQIWCWNKLTR